MLYRILTLCGVTLVTLSLISCSKPGPTPIIYGTDLCDYCDMTIADKAFGTELVTKKRKVLKYDSIECLAAAEVKGALDSVQVHSRWVTDFGNPEVFLTVDQAIIVATDRQKSPMGIGLVAVAEQAVAEVLIDQKGGRMVSWEETKQLVAETWKLTGGK